MGIRRRGRGCFFEGNCWEFWWSALELKKREVFDIIVIGIGLRWNFTFNPSDDFGESAQQGSSGIFVLTLQGNKVIKITRR